MFSASLQNYVTFPILIFGIKTLVHLKYCGKLLTMLIIKSNFLHKNGCSARHRTYLFSDSEAFLNSIRPASKTVPNLMKV